jgi:hypothetical protein
MLKSAKWVVAILLLVVVGLAGCALYTAWSGHASGSMWGTDVRVWANLALPLFSFAGALAIVLGFLVQQEQINKQQKQFNQRQFEATFFNLLEIHHRITEDLRWSDKTGQAAFINFYREIKKKWNRDRWPKQKEQYDEKAARLAVQGVVNQGLKGADDNFIVLLNNVLNILKQIDESEIDADVKRDYAATLRYHLSDSERNVLFFYVAGTDRYERYKALIEKYGMLEETSIGEDFVSEFEDLFGENAYGSNDTTDGEEEAQ